MDDRYNVEITDTIDSVAYNTENKMLILWLVDGMDWSDEAMHLTLLKKKLNSYLYYVDTGQYEESYPDTERIELRICFRCECPELCMIMLDAVRNVLEGLFENSALIIEFGDECISEYL